MAAPDQASEQRSDDGDPPHAGSIGEAIVAKAGEDGKKARAEVARGIDGIAVHAAKAHADGDHDQADQRRSKIRLPEAR